MTTADSTTEARLIFSERGAYIRLPAIEAAPKLGRSASDLSNLRVKRWEYYVYTEFSECWARKRPPEETCGD
jgi:hypothetical protein